MTARMQAASNSGKPILLRTSAKSGHGAGGLSQSIERQADIYTFILKELNMPFHHDK
jgi:prolyl oligopeptidase